MPARQPVRAALTARSTSRSSATRRIRRSAAFVPLPRTDSAGTTKTSRFPSPAETTFPAWSRVSAIRQSPPKGAGQSATGDVEDNAGSSTNSATVGGINIDRTDPTIFGSASPAANAAGLVNEAVSVAFDCNDDRSGVASCGPGATLASDGAGQSVTARRPTRRSNSGDPQHGINIDEMKPTIVRLDRSGVRGRLQWLVRDISTGGIHVRR